MVMTEPMPALPQGLLMEPLPNPKRRALMRYWRLIGGEWMQTHLLPSDPVNRDRYLRRGFRLTKPSPDAEATLVVVDVEKETMSAELAQLRAENEKLKAAIGETTVTPVSPKRKRR